MYEDYIQKRQHKSMIFLEAINSLKYALLPIAFILLGRFIEGEVFRTIALFFGSVIAFFLAAVIYHVVQWAFYTYRLEKGYLHIKAGIIFKKERSIKSERVQTVNIQTGILQRLLGVASLEVETAGGGKESELSLNAVSKKEALKIKAELENNENQTKTQAQAQALNQDQIQAEHTSSETVSDSETVSETASGEQKVSSEKESTEEIEEIKEVYKLPLGELFLAGATSGGFLVLFSLMAAAFSQLYPMLPDGFWSFILDRITSTTWVMVIFIIILMLIVSWLVSTLGFVIKYADFSISRRKDQLEISWGIIQQKQLNLKLHRLQALVLHESILRQSIGRLALTAEVAGGGSKDENYITFLLPLLHKEELNTFLKKILPEYSIPQNITPLPKRARKRYIIRAVIYPLLVLVPIQLLPFPYLWLGFFLVIPAGILGYLRYLDSGTALEDRQILFRFRNINRYNILMHKQHVQSLELSANPLQRWSKLRTLHGSVLSSPQGKTYQVVDLNFQVAQNLWKWYSRYS